MNLRQANVVLLGLAFHFIFFSFQTSVFVQQTVVNSLISRPDNQFHGNAYLSLCITYTIFALSNWLAPSIIAITGVKFGMILGACTYVLYSASFLFPTTCLYYTAAALIGFGAAPLWTAQGAFLAKQSDASTASKNAAIFWSMLQSSLLFGNLFVYFAFTDHSAPVRLASGAQSAQTNSTGAPEQFFDEQRTAAKISDQTRYVVYGVLTLVCALGVMVLLLLRDGTREELSKLKHNAQSAQNSPSTNINSSSSSSSSSGHFDEFAQDLDKISALEQFLGSVKLARSGNMLLLSTAFLFTGQLLSFFTGVYGTSIGATSQFGDNPKRFIGLAGIAIGIGEILGGAIFGLLGSRGLGNKLRRDLVFVLGFFVVVGALALTFVNLPPDSPLANQSARLSAIITPRLWITMVASVLIGFGDACFNTQIYSQLMSANSVAAFALFKFTQSVGSAIAFLYSTKLDLYFQIVILGFMATLATVCLLLVESRTSNAARQRKSGNEAESSASSSISNINIAAKGKSESQQSILRATS